MCELARLFCGRPRLGSEGLGQSQIHFAPGGVLNLPPLFKKAKMAVVIDNLPPSVSRMGQLREAVVNALSDISAACPSDDFCDGFALEPEHRERLATVHQQALASLRSNTLVELDQITNELGVDSSLERLDTLVAQQPPLPDGTRCEVATVGEATELVSRASKPAKELRKEQLRQALRQVDEENAALQEQYVEQAAALQAASAQIQACQSQLRQTAQMCEQGQRGSTAP